MTTKTRAELAWELADTQRELANVRLELQQERQKSERRLKRKVERTPSNDVWREIL